MSNNKKLTKRTVTWLDLAEALRVAGILSPGEEISDITLVKPRQLLLYTEPKRGG